jgi:hypothetical protein
MQTNVLQLNSWGVPKKNGRRSLTPLAALARSGIYHSIFVPAFLSSQIFAIAVFFQEIAAEEVFAHGAEGYFIPDTYGN